MEAAKAEVPKTMAAGGVRTIFEAGVEFILRRHRESRTGWLRFGLPLMCGTDILEILARPSMPEREDAEGR
jgi:uncharacterized membrane protein